MKIERKLIVTIETWQKTIMYQRQTQAVWCNLCAAKVEMLSPAQAAIVSNATERIIFRQIELGELHFVETADGSVLICSGSLAEKNLFKE